MHVSLGCLVASIHVVEVVDWINDTPWLRLIETLFRGRD